MSYIKNSTSLTRNPSCLPPFTTKTFAPFAYSRLHGEIFPVDSCSLDEINVDVQSLTEWEGAGDGILPQPADQIEFECSKFRVREQMGERMFEAAWAEGWKMSLEKVNNYVRGKNL